MNKYLRAVSANYAFFFINTIFFLVITPVAIRVMGEELYGLWAILNAILLFSGVGILSMGTIVNKFASEDDSKAPPINGIISSGIIILLPMAMLIMFVIFLTRGWISKQFGVNNEQQFQIELALVFTAISVMPQFLGRIPHGYLLSQLKNNLARSVESGANIATWLGAVIIAFFFQNLLWMALWGLLIQILSMLVLFALVLPKINFCWQYDPRTLQRMLNFSGFTFLESLAVALFQNFDRLIVGALLGPIAAGVYSVATSAGLRLTIVVGQIAEVLIPYVSKKNSTKEHKSLYKTFRQVSQISNLMLGIFSSMMILWMDVILNLWISIEYSHKYTSIFRIIVIAYVFLSASRIGHQTLIGLGQVKKTAIIYTLTSFFLIASVFIFSLNFSLLGAAYANLLMIILLSFNVIIYLYFSKQSPIKELFIDSWIALALPFFAYGVTSFNEFKNHSLVNQILLSLALILITTISIKSNKTLALLQTSLLKNLTSSRK